MLNIEKGEKIIFEIRRHSFVLFTRMLSVFMLTIIPAFLIKIVGQLNIAVTFGDKSALTVVVFFYAFWILIMWIVAFVFWTDNHLDVWVITNKKIIAIEQKGLFNREISYIHFDKVQDITTEVHGITATILDYGEIHIQTAGEQKEFIMKNIKDPKKSREKINEIFERESEYINQDI
jgi:uncharacterized membrane protein YdbT with pleckstrin-like domain